MSRFTFSKLPKPTKRRYPTSTFNLGSDNQFALAIKIQVSILNIVQKFLLKLLSWTIIWSPFLLFDFIIPI